MGMATDSPATGHQVMDVLLMENKNPDDREYAQRVFTTVDIPAEPPKDYIVWSLCTFVYGNPLCLGLAALIYSIKARDRKVVGDLDGARHHASTARTLNIVATFLLCFIFYILIYQLVEFLRHRRW